MTEPIRIDSHIHIFESGEDGLACKKGYEIWEYGQQEQVALSVLSGTVEELIAAMAGAGIVKGVIVNLLIPDVERRKAVRSLPPGLNSTERGTALTDFEAGLRDRLVDFNRWACQVAQAHPEIETFVGIDVALMSAKANAQHLRNMVDTESACGVKLHGPAQGFFMGDERLWPTYTVCQEMGLPVIGHSGPDEEGRGFAEPRAFGAALAAFPEVPIVLAHMGGATWGQAREMADSYANAYFDCCEIIEWTRSEKGPSDTELACLIRDIGADRVMMGSDFPWYDLDHTVERVLELPVLSQEEKEGIIGANALRILKL